MHAKHGAVQMQAGGGHELAPKRVAAGPWPDAVELEAAHGDGAAEEEPVANRGCGARRRCPNMSWLAVPLHSTIVVDN